MIEYLIYGFIIGAGVWAVALLWCAAVHRDDYKEWLKNEQH